MCDDPSVNRRARLLIILCAILALVRICGVHAHLSLTHDGSLQPVHSSLQHLADDHAPDHLASHLALGDIDVEVAAKGFGKLSSLLLFAALAPLFVLFVFAARLTFIQRCPPPSSLPKVRRRSYLLPPSQAPPATHLIG
jgi:hypothetical protein